MKIYMAALYSNGYRHTNRYTKLNEREKQIVDALPFTLESYHYIQKDQFVRAIRERDDKVFLDSGAFSAYTIGSEIRLTDYCAYILANMDIIQTDDGLLVASVLDDIKDPQKTYDNQMSMQALGVTPLPCFHAGEDERYLEWYVRHYDYITLGGMVGAGTQQLAIWLDRVWSKYLLDGSGRPRLKVHGFGITSIPLMQRYPWWSCDSSSWVQSAAFGSVITPEFGPLSVSSQSPDRHAFGRHYTTLTPLERRRVEESFVANGFDYDRLSTVYESRAAYNLWAFKMINDQINNSDRTHLGAQRQELF